MLPWAVLTAIFLLVVAVLMFGDAIKRKKHPEVLLNYWTMIGKDSAGRTFCRQVETHGRFQIIPHDLRIIRTIRVCAPYRISACEEIDPYGNIYTHVYGVNAPSAWDGRQILGHRVGVIISFEHSGFRSCTGAQKVKTWLGRDENRFAYLKPTQNK